MILVVLINKVDDDFDHCVFFFGAAFGDHQGEGDKGIVGNTLGAVLIIKDAIAQHLDQLAQLIILLGGNSLVDGVTL